MESEENQPLVQSRHPYSYQHICQECQNEFYGRKNRIYCSSACKIRSNNLKAAERRSGVLDQTRMLEKNSQILKGLYMGKGGPIKATIKKLIELGFLQNGPNIRLLDANQVEWCQIGFYIFNVNSTTGFVTIMTRSDLENL